MQMDLVRPGPASDACVDVFMQSLGRSHAHLVLTQLTLDPRRAGTQTEEHHTPVAMISLSRT